MSFIYKLILLVDNKFKSDHQVSEDLIREAEGTYLITQASNPKSSIFKSLNP